jgi:hypothetical protein
MWASVRLMAKAFVVRLRTSPTSRFKQIHISRFLRCILWPRIRNHRAEVYQPVA